MNARHAKLNEWVKENTAWCRPDAVIWCDGSKEEYDRLMKQMVAGGMAIPLAKRPNSFLFRSQPSDVARIEVAHLYQHGPTGTMPVRPTTGSIRESSRRR